MQKFMDTDGRWQRVPADKKYPGTNIFIPKRCRLKDSVIMAWVRKGNSLSGKRAEILANIGNNSFLQAAQILSAKGASTVDIKSAQQTVEYQSKLECFMMEACPESGFSKALFAILEKLDVENAADIDIPAITALEYDSFVAYLMAKVDADLGVEGLFVSSHMCIQWHAVFIYLFIYLFISYLFPILYLPLSVPTPFIILLCAGTRGRVPHSGEVFFNGRRTAPVAEETIPHARH